MTASGRTLLPLLAAEAFANLLSVAQRSALALIGIIIGTAAVIAMLDAGHNAEVESMRQFKAMGTDLIIAQSQSMGGGGPSATVIEDIPRTLPDIRLSAPVAITGMRVGRGNGIQANVIGSTAGLASVIRLQLAEGRFLDRFDTSNTFAVIGARVARAPEIAGASPLHPGALIRLGSYHFTVIGVLAETASNPLLPFDVNTAVFLPIGSMRRIADVEASTVIASAADGRDPVAAATALGERLRQLWRGQPVHAHSAQQLIEGMQRQARIMATLLAAIGGISLLVGGVGVMNVMLMNVAERRQEIGLRLALGARRSHIRTMFQMEAALLSLTGGVCGTALGTLAAFLYAHFSGWEFVPSSLALPFGAIISTGVGLFFGVYPAATAASLDPIEALRAE